MASIFPSEAWVKKFHEKLNSDEQYARIAAKWEGDLIFEVEAAGALKSPITIYLDLWHGSCRSASYFPSGEIMEAAFILRAPYDNFVRVLLGQLDPMQAMLTRKLRVKGSMAYMMRNVPVILDFVRCAQEITHEVLDS